MQPGPSVRADTLDAVKVSAVSGGEAILPCDTRSPQPTDVLLLVVWYKDDVPIYSGRVGIVHRRSCSPLLAEHIPAEEPYQPRIVPATAKLDQARPPTTPSGIVFFYKQMLTIVVA
ncbi:hypothetical protein ACJJTC_007151 [Scirpophaga incertulas]